jgi:hypothetical protein
MLLAQDCFATRNAADKAHLRKNNSDASNEPNGTGRVLPVQIAK